MARKTVVIGLYGTTLDAGHNEARWVRWRPSVAICQQPEWRVDRFELLAHPNLMRTAAQVVTDIAKVSPATLVNTHALAIADPWDFSEVYAALGDFADRYAWQPAREDYYLHITTGTHVAQICLFLLCETRAMPGVLLQSSPARGATREKRAKTGAIGRIDVIDLELAKYDRLAARFAARQALGASLLKAGIATKNTAFNAMIDELEHVASRSKDPLLLTGETGTGKTALCRRLYDLKRARQHLAGPFVAVNCATLRGDLAASALFGHGKGAFTGATDARAGFLRAADKGLLFLDEVGELGADEQAMLLKAIEEKRFYPVGSDREVASDFQLVCGTNRDLRAGTFRDDLLARLSLWTFRLPALRERPEDLAPNLDYELDRVGAELGHRASMSKPARDAFLRFAAAAPWRANFRDFGAAVRRMITLGEGGRVDEAGVRAEIARLDAAWGSAPVLGPALDRFDRVQLDDAIAVCRASPSLSAAGRVLFAESLKARATKNDADRLRKYLARFDLDFETLRGA